ncbi:anhydro-N-acetylmuramic acid kinase [Neptuniibacter halophilus]|uniref:anhydro-N-acetylmuramic acid kinase n=1 Tax=Neptuniibacter halophilus TaxID=651666 RepID=UPI0025730A64|nr:anhydro-N-acetylmuramic acid kinase [Neptuniibacter halophilus]
MSASPLYIGLMSGTSLDSIDAVAVRFEPTFELVASHSESFPAQLKQAISQLTLPGDNEIDRMGRVDIALGDLFAQAVSQLLTQHGLNPAEIRAIGSHGQTIRHRPEFSYTLQIGDANRIAELTGITTVTDFRRRDMAAGGQGAPLVPAFHRAMLHNPEQDRVLLNVGGMANLTFLPANPCEPVRGFDTGPGNILMDLWIQHCLGSDYDKDGQWASSGKVNNALLQDLLRLPYFQLPPPKSTGREQFNQQWLQDSVSRHDLPAEDIQRTLLELTARSVADSLQQHIPSQSFELLVCGGGSRNGLLLHRLAELLPGKRVSPTDQAGIDADWMEAAAFAWLAKRCLDGMSGNLSPVTGAAGERILGAIYQA